MKLLVIHISDLHLRATANPAVDRMKLVATSLRSLDAHVDSVLVAVSGDVAHSGKSAEYAIALLAFRDLVESLQASFAGVAVNFVAVPGNHDCDFGDPTVATRKLILDGLGRTSAQNADSTTVDLCCGVHAAFFQFLARIQTTEPVAALSKLYYEYSFAIGDKSVSVRCYNTAFSSSLPEVPGSMVFPVELIPEPSNHNPDYVIGVFHHPSNWLMPSAKRGFCSHIDKTVDLVLTGHEHSQAYYKKETYGGPASDFIEGAVFQEHDDSSTCAFNAVLINLLVAEERIFQLQWEKDHFSTSDMSSGWRPYRRSPGRKEFELTEAMQKRLEDPGATFTHPAKPDISLDDIYVPPNAEELVFQNGKDLTKAGMIGSRQLLGKIGEKRKVLIIGRERCGKTALAKILFRKFYALGHIPVLIEGDQIKSHELEAVTTVISRRLQQDYVNPIFDKFQQLEPDRVVVIIDDLDHAERLNARGRLKLLENLNTRYSRIIVLGDDLLRLEEIANGELGARILSDYTQLELKEYGHVLRSALIDKWYDINNEYSANPDLLRSKITVAEQLIDEIIKRSYLPSYPIFILTMLQGIDTAQPIANSAGSYGYLYQVLITDRLTKIGSTISLEKKLSYLVELAYHLFRSRHRELSEPEFEVFHLKYCRDFPAVDRAQIFSDLERAGILEIYDRQYRFKYLYFYYYFVAQYLARHIEEDATREVIVALCDQFDKEEHANIWLFLTHQARSPFLLATIANHAKGFFAGVAAPAFDKDVNFLQALYSKVPELVLVNKSIDELRSERRERLDQDTSVEGSLPEQAEDPEAEEIVRLISRLKAAVRTLEVMGQIVKNFAASMKADPRYTLVKECYELGLRVTGVILKEWEESGEEFTRQIMDIVLEKGTDIETRMELEREMKSVIFYFCETISLGLLKRISQAVGTRDLTDTYEQLVTDTPTNAYKLIDLSIKLDHLGLPTGEIFRLNDEFQDNVFCGRLLRRLVLNHFYLFSSSDQVKQKVCGRLGIKIEQLRSVDYKTHEQKRLSEKSSAV